MKTKVKEKQKKWKSIDFPCLMIAKSDGAIVLFTEIDKGTFIHKGDAFNPLG